MQRRLCLALAAAALAAPGCAYDDYGYADRPAPSAHDYGDYGYDGDAWKDDDRDGRYDHRDSDWADAPRHHGDHGRDDRRGGHGGHHPGGGDRGTVLVGPGVDRLDPWLADTEEGRTIVRLGFREAGNGVVSDRVADRANIWFRRYADENRDMRLTDPEIRTALVAAAGQYLR